MALVGIARFASQAAPLENKRSVTYLQLPTRSWITRCTAPRMPFQWMINPYRGCEFGCKYCYARYTHEFMELREPEDFETRIFAKHFQAAAFQSELARVGIGEHIAIGTATDPYQPAERRFGLTRRILRILAGGYGRRISLTTKSDLVARDAELLRDVARRNSMQVNMTVTTMDAALARLIEPRAPRPDLRIGAVAALRGVEVRAGVFCSPVLPLINDSYESLSAVARAAKAAGAARFGAGILFLKPCAYRVFLPFLEERFPKLVARYRKQYEGGAFLRGLYPEAMEMRMNRVRRETGLEGDSEWYRAEEVADPQMSLFTIQST